MAEIRRSPAERSVVSSLLDIRVIIAIIRHKSATINFFDKRKPPHTILKIICGGKLFDDLFLLRSEGIPEGARKEYRGVKTCYNSYDKRKCEFLDRMNSEDVYHTDCKKSGNGCVYRTHKGLTC